MDKALQQLKQLPDVLLPWYDAHRRTLPWREEVSPYRTWVSEIMLQQTRVAAVIPYFLRFMDAFPTVNALAEADTEQLMKLWEGLGYYSRARNLQKAAQQIVQRGSFPDTYEDVLALPGIGDYTAGAILSIAFGQKIPAVDGNVLRVASRITGSEDNILDTKTRSRFRALMVETMPDGRPGAFNQALMDLGATVCLPGGEPLCAKGIVELLKLLKAQGLHVLVETAGACDADVLRECAPYVDEFYFDIKHTDAQRHKELTGASPEHILQNLAVLDALGAKTRLRCLLVNGLTTDPVHMERVADLYQTLQNCTGVQLLRYHPMGGSKAAALGLAENGNAAWIPTDEQVAQAAHILQARQVPILT